MRTQHTLNSPLATPPGIVLGPSARLVVEVVR